MLDRGHDASHLGNPAVPAPRQLPLPDDTPPPEARPDRGGTPCPWTARTVGALTGSEDAEKTRRAAYSPRRGASHVSTASFRSAFRPRAAPVTVASSSPYTTWFAGAVARSCPGVWLRKDGGAHMKPGSS
eukprot:scaffold4824_cov383-Prasinococcus_capsulatus_cf.AAC.2